jgi:hypothetical protein
MVVSFYARLAHFWQFVTLVLQDLQAIAAQRVTLQDLELPSLYCMLILCNALPSCRVTFATLGKEGLRIGRTVSDIDSSMNANVQIFSLLKVIRYSLGG